VPILVLFKSTQAGEVLCSVVYPDPNPGPHNFSSLRIRIWIRIRTRMKKNPGPHSDPHQSYKLDPEPHLDSHLFDDDKPKSMEYEPI
jgi:hypothetical protein